MDTHANIDPNAGYGYLIDTTKCIGCRACQVSCKQWNDLKAQKTEITGRIPGLQEPARFTSNTFTVVSFNEVTDAKAPGGMKYVMAKRMCMHCNDPACASACPVTALHKTAEGPVTYDSEKCIGCRYCMWACPFGVPTAEWDSLAPKIRKCTMCSGRDKSPAPAERNGEAYADAMKTSFAGAFNQPICTKACPPGALKFGKRGALIEEARARIAADPERYHDGIYGEKEVGGTAVMYLAPVPFADIGLPTLGAEALPKRSAVALGAVPAAVIGVGAALGGVYALGARREAVRKAEPAKPAQAHHHPEFAPVPGGKFWTVGNVLLAALMLLGAVSFVARFALGLGGATNLSDTYAWGLWILFDLVWIAVAAGAFATAGIIYVFRREDLYSIGRGAVLMGLLSYSFVTVTLLADLGLPWHFYQLGLQAPKHSAMFEVSWCVGLYVTVLAFEFLPVPLRHFGMKSALEKWQKWSPWYVVGAMTLFVWLMSRSVAYAAAAAAVFAVLAVAFRTRAGEKPVPVMLAIAAVSLSAMHQSSLGSLFLLMPDKLDPAWWSPVMPVAFFLSSVAAGLGLVILVEMWIARTFGRKLRQDQLATLGKITFWALLVYGVFRVGDVVLRGQLGHALSQPLFLAEVVLGIAVPLAMLATDAARRKPNVLGIGAALATGGIVLNRMNVVIFANHLKGTAPLSQPQPYFPSLVEWGISLGLIAATIFLFGLAVRFLPILPKDEGTGASH